MEMVIVQSQPLFKQSDIDKDDHLTREEFAAFMNPESHPHMLEVLVQTFREQYDSDEDGYISFDEYMSKKHTTPLPPSVSPFPSSLRLSISSLSLSFLSSISSLFLSLYLFHCSLSPPFLRLPSSHIHAPEHSGGG